MSQRGFKKKGKSSKFDGRKDRQVDSGLAVTVQTHGGSILTSKIAEEGLNGGVLRNFKLLSEIKQNIFWGAKDAIIKD